MSKELKCYIAEVMDVRKYKKMHDEATTEAEKTMYAQMHNDEEKHAKMIMEAYPEIMQEMEELKEMLEKVV
jgi:hypothetical protein